MQGIKGDMPMANAWEHPDADKPPVVRDWRKKMSDNIAYALLVYTGLQIFVTMSALHGSEGGSLLPYFALIVLVAAIIPACRLFERRWNRLSEAQAHDPALRRYFRRDLLMLWALAIGLPFLVTGMFKLLAMLAHH
jgi:hypothetical protein